MSKSVRLPEKIHALLVRLSHWFVTFLLISMLANFGCSMRPWWQNEAPKPSDDLWQNMRQNFKLEAHPKDPAVQAALQHYLKNKTILKKALERAKPYIYFILKSVEKQNLPAELCLVPIVESEYSPFAYSWAGATGLWQMMPGTASGLGLSINWWIDERRDIIKSTHAAIQYFSYLNDFFDGNWPLAIVSYDAGVGRVQRAAKKQPGKLVWQLNLPKEATAYYPKILALQLLIKSPHKYHISLPKIKNQSYFQVVTVTNPIALKKIAKMAKITMHELRLLNPGFRRWSAAPKGPYKILLPTQSVTPFKTQLKKHHHHHMHLHLKKHRIKAGENLKLIALKYKTSVQKIMEINQLKQQKILTNRILWVPHDHFVPLVGYTVKQAKKIRADKSPGPKKIIYYTHPRDSLKSIARHFNVDVRELLYWNQLKPHAVIKPGQVLLIWKRPRFKHGKRFYKVKKGDTLWDITHDFDISIAQLKHYNHINKHHLRIGQILRVR